MKKFRWNSHFIAALVPLSLFLSVLSHSAHSADSLKVEPLNDPMIIAQQFSFESDVLGVKRNFYIHLPANYANSTKRYPVMFMTDARDTLQQISSVTQQLSTSAQRIPEMIVVAITNNGGRAKDLSERPHTMNFLSFIVDELKPYIHQHYKTNGENLLLGASMGGEFVIRALFERPEAFDAYFSMSPSIYKNDLALVKKAKSISLSGQKITKKLYISLANEGFNFGVDELIFGLRKFPIKGLKWSFTKSEQESHGSIGMVSAHRDLQDYYSQWAAPHFKNLADFEKKGGLQGLQKIYAKRESSKIPRNILNHLSWLYIDAKQGQKAIDLALFNVKVNPTSGSAPNNLGKLYEQLNDDKNAQYYYQQALDKAIKNKHRASSIQYHRDTLSRFKNKP
jgi:tetratricopeptide (TPR) repeat protein